MLTINGVVVPHAVHAAERDGPDHDPIADWAKTNGVELERPKGSADPLHVPLQQLRDRLNERAAAARKERERVRERNARLSAGRTLQHAPAKPARAAAKAASTQPAPTPDAPNGKKE